MHGFLAGFRFKCIPFRAHSSLYAWKLTKRQGFGAVLLNGNEKFLETLSLLGTSYGKERVEEKPFPSKTLTEKRCALQNYVGRPFLRQQGGWKSGRLAYVG